MYARWAAEADSRIALTGVQLRGRETRYREAPLQRMEEIVGEIAPAIVARADAPYALFGHSMGALIAFEVARELRRHGAACPRALLLSAFRTPGEPSRTKHVLDLSDEEFIAYVSERYGTLPPAILADKELLAHYLPAMRADLAVLSTHHSLAEAPLESPFVLYNGLADPLITRDQLQGWGELTTGGCRERWFPGGHFYVREQRSDVLAAIAADILE